MSYVTNTILTFSIMEDKEEKMDLVNKFFDNGMGFVHIENKNLPRGWYGGSKMMETNIALGAFNYLHLAELISYLKSIKWEEPDNVQLFVCDQYQHVFEDVLKKDNNESKE